MVFFYFAEQMGIVFGMIWVGILRASHERRPASNLIASLTSESAAELEVAEREAGSY